MKLIQSTGWLQVAATLSKGGVMPAYYIYRVCVGLKAGLMGQK